MIETITIEGYRKFRRLSMRGLGRINLLVGMNNSGKTSVLEALYLLATAGDPNSVWRIIGRRGERIESETPSREPDFELDTSHLFYGHELRVGQAITIASTGKNMDRFIRYKVRDAGDKEVALEAYSDRSVPLNGRLQIVIEGSPTPAARRILLTRQGGIRASALDGPRRPLRETRESTAAQFVSTESVSIEYLSNLWNKIVLTEAEDRVLEALRFLDPDIERIAAVVSPRYYYNSSNRGGFVVRLRGVEQPVPIGSLGDGTWRILALAISLIQSKGGILLVDEIDTGLHYTVMADMWKLISEIAEYFDVQVFATTHSSDCVKSLATICHPKNKYDHDVSIQRIDVDREQAVPYTEAQIVLAAEKNIEIR